MIKNLFFLFIFLSRMSLTAEFQQNPWHHFALQKDLITREGNTLKTPIENVVPEYVSWLRQLPHRETKVSKDKLLAHNNGSYVVLSYDVNTDGVCVKISHELTLWNDEIEKSKLANEDSKRQFLEKILCHWADWVQHEKNNPTVASENSILLSQLDIQENNIVFLPIPPATQRATHVYRDSWKDPVELWLAKFDFAKPIKLNDKFELYKYNAIGALFTSSDNSERAIAINYEAGRLSISNIKTTDEKAKSVQEQREFLKEMLISLYYFVFIPEDFKSANDLAIKEVIKKYLNLSSNAVNQ